MSEKMCPLIGTKCAGFECEWFMSLGPNEPDCAVRLLVRMGSDQHRMTEVLMKETSNANEMNAQFVKSTLLKQPTEELMNLLEVKPDDRECAGAQ